MSSETESFRQLINQHLSDLIDGTRLTAEYASQAIKYAFAQVPRDRPILQQLVNDYCEDWHEGGDDEELGILAHNELPQSFLLRVTRRFAELKRMQKEEVLSGRYFYYEHDSEEDKKVCMSLHMQYSEKRDYGYFLAE
jgi:hypothetical protein